MERSNVVIPTTTSTSSIFHCPCFFCLLILVMTLIIPSSPNILASWIVCVFVSLCAFCEWTKMTHLCACFHNATFSFFIICEWWAFCNETFFFVVCELWTFCNVQKNWLFVNHELFTVKLSFFIVCEIGMFCNATFFIVYELWTLCNPTLQF
jgi:hypothetical protein